MKLSLSVLVLSAFALTSALAETLGNDAIAVEFGGESDGFGVRRIVNRIDGDVPFVKGSPDGVDFWALLFHARGADGKIEEARVDNKAPAAARRIEKDGALWRFVWEGLDLPGEKGAFDVIASVRLVGRNATSWELEVRNRSAKWGLFETQYPYLREVVGEGEADVMLPGQYLGARLYRRHTSERFVPDEDFNYSWYPMVSAFMRDGAGIFLAPFDGEGRIKRLRFLKNHDLAFVTPVENAGLAGKAAKGPKYPVVIAAYRGDWYEAAKMYRKWALRQKWAAKGPIARRADSPKRMAECHGWLMAELEAPGVSNFVVKVRKRFPDVKFACEWTKWGNQPFDTNYPEMLPSRLGVDKVMAFGTEAGLPLMPYTNGRVWDTEQASWHYAKKDCTKDETGACNIEVYGRNRKFGVMCPYAADWQTCLADYMIRLAEGLRCGLLYIDQIACSRAKPCFDPAHGHPLGGGTWWADGNRALLGSIHAALSKRGVPMTSEGANEIYLDVIDGYELACRPQPEDIPFFTYVYGGYGTYFASEMGFDTEFLPFWTVYARATIWGVEPGLSYSWPLNSGKERFGEAFADCARFRERAKEFLAYGHLTGEVKFTDEPATFTTSWRKDARITYTGEFPEVMGTVWQNADDTRQAVALANLTDRRQNVAFREPFAGEAVLEPYSLSLVTCQ